MLITSKEAALLSLLIFGFCNLKAVSCDNNDGLDRMKKHFSLFSVVTFKNEECSSETTFNGGQLAGTCYSATECSDKDGTKSGNCAAGFGVCCIFIHNTLTSVTITENRTHLQNPLFPSTETAGAGTTTTYTINKMQNDICQVRLDFSDFVIAGPANTDEYIKAASDDHCNDKWTTTLSSGASVPVLCGVMTGEHIYMDIGMDAADNAVIALALAAATVTEASVSGILVANAFRKWRVKTSQIPCWATYRAPEGCHRYLTGTVGQIASPNFRDLSTGARGDNLLNARTDLAKQSLNTCIRREAGFCCVLFQVCNQFAGIELIRSSSLGVVADGELNLITQGWSFQTYFKEGGDNGIGTKTIVHNDVGIVDGGCTTDYVGIPDSTTGVKSKGAAIQTNSRYCGARFGFVPANTVVAGENNHNPIWDCTEPFEVYYFTDQVNDNGVQADAVPPVADATGTVGRGMCLDYSQEAC